MSHIHRISYPSQWPPLTAPSSCDSFSILPALGRVLDGWNDHSIALKDESRETEDTPSNKSNTFVLSISDRPFNSSLTPFLFFCLPPKYSFTSFRVQSSRRMRFRIRTPWRKGNKTPKTENKREKMI